MLELIDELFTVVFYSAKFLRMSLILGVFESLKSCILWIIKPPKKEIKCTRLQKV